MTNTNLFRLVYCSRNRIRGDRNEVAAELNNILDKARRNNSKEDVTGALLYNEGNFAQVLEGPLASVENIFEKIQCDPRHSEVTVLENGSAESRQFPDWAMGFTGNTADDHMPAATAAFQSAFLQQEGAGDQILGVLRDLVVQEHEWILLDAA